MADTTPYQPHPLLDLYDDFVDFNACCAYFCDAVAALGLQQTEWLDRTSAEGLCIQAQQIKERSAEIKEALAAVRRAAQH